ILCLGAASGGVFGSSNALCAVSCTAPGSLSNSLNTSASHGCMCGTQYQRRALDHHDRAPDVDQHVPALEPPFSLVSGQQIAGEIGHRARAVVDVGAVRRLVVAMGAGGVGADDRPEADNLVR